MSFVFPSWATAFSEGFHEDAKAMLEGALNKVCAVFVDGPDDRGGCPQLESLHKYLHDILQGNKPPVIQGRIEVVELSMGTQVCRVIGMFRPSANAIQPPTLTLLEIGDLSLDRFRGIFRLGYQGDAWLEVRCRVQASGPLEAQTRAYRSLRPTHCLTTPTSLPTLPFLFQHRCLHLSHCWFP